MNPQILQKKHPSLTQKMKETTTIRQEKEWFIKPKNQSQTEPLNRPVHIHLTPWDLVFLSVHYNQKGLLYTKPPNQPNFSIHKLVDTLKESLSLALVHFYPLAGQLGSRTDHDKQETVVYIDCTKGPGVQFIQANLEMTIKDIISQNEVVPTKVVHSLFDHNDWRIVNYDGQTRPLLSVQVTELVDGVFIGCSMNHVVGDGSSFWHFWNMWSEIHRAYARGDEEVVRVSRPPVLDRWFPSDRRGGSSLPFALPFTHPDQFIHRYEPPPQLVDRIFHISSNSITKLKAKANKEINSNIISSFQALAAVVWRAIIRAKGLEPEEVTECRLAANNRSRLDPPLSNDYFGNSVQPIITRIPTSQLVEQSLGWVALLLHRSVVNHKDNVVRGFVNKWVEAPYVVDIGKVVDANTIKIGSSPRFDVYGNEFAWLGKPVSIRSGFVNRFDGKVNTHPGCQGGGSIDLEICLMPKFMKALESDHEFINVISSTI